MALLEEHAYGHYTPHDLVRDFARELAKADGTKADGAKADVADVEGTKAEGAKGEPADGEIPEPGLP